MRKLFFCILLLTAISSAAQTITDLGAYYGVGGSRIVVLLSDNSVWSSSAGKDWQKAPSHGTGGQANVSTNNIEKTISVYSDSKSTWEPVDLKEMPVGMTIKIFSPYYITTKRGKGGETRYLIAGDDNKLWTLSGGKWKSMTSDGLPSGYDIRVLRSYQKFDMRGNGEMRFLALLKDNSIWWTTGHHWMLMKSTGLPAQNDILHFDLAVEATAEMSQTFGRLVIAMSDNSLWYLPLPAKKWIQIPGDGLPAGYKIYLLRVFLKYGSDLEPRVIVALEDNSLWWYAGGKTWSQIPTESLPLKAR